MKINFKNKLKHFGINLLKTTLRFIFYFILITVLWVLLYKFINPPYTFTMIQRKWEAFQSNKPNTDIQKSWKKIDSVAPHFFLAVIAAEDQKFLHHNGFDFESMQKAFKANYSKKGKKNNIKGASTISQQTAKNVFLWQSRTYLRKALEAYFTLLIELFWSKKRILEVYVNVIETGNMCFGIEAASQKYFKKNAAHLSNHQAALIAVCLPSPRKYNPAQPSSFIEKRKNWCIQAMHHLGGVQHLRPII